MANLCAAARNRTRDADIQKNELVRLPVSDDLDQGNSTLGFDSYEDLMCGKEAYDKMAQEDPEKFEKLKELHKAT